jgi:hypothetical protein
MSFSFIAIGTADEVRAQLAEYETDNVLGARLAETLTEQFAPELLPAAHGGYEYRYVVKAYGHSGGSSALHLQADVEAHWVPIVKPDADKLAEELTEALADETGAGDED